MLVAKKLSKTVTELHPNIYLIYGRNRSAHAYLIKGTHRNVLIDCCLPDARDHVVACLAELDLRPDDIDLLLLTHEHIDHAGCAPYFAHHALVGAHRLAANKLTVRDEFVLNNKAFNGIEREEFRLDLSLVEGTVINLGKYDLQVIHTPGHCSGAVCFFEPRHKLLFSGDVVMADGIVGGVLQSGNVSDYIDSLRKLSALRVEQIFPGHGKMSISGEADIEKAIARLEELLDESKMLFEAIQNSQLGFEHIVRSLRDLNR